MEEGQKEVEAIWETVFLQFVGWVVLRWVGHTVGMVLQMVLQMVLHDCRTIV